MAGRAGGGAAGGSADEEASKPVLTEPSHKFYVGFDYQNARLSVSDSGSVGGVPAADYDANFYDLRVGYRVLEAVGLEAHYGIPANSDDDPGKVKQDHYYAAFIVPTATVFESFELSLPVGYTNSRIVHTDATGTQDATLGGIAYGLRLEVPVRVVWHALPDLRLTGGGMVYHQKSGARDYGFHYGLRYDFGF